MLPKTVAYALYLIRNNSRVCYRITINTYPMNISNSPFQMFLLRHSLIVIILLTIIGGIFRFYDLNWGAPYYFHPDERNIASSISQLRFPDNLNPHFFAYGSFPIYTVFFIGTLVNFFSSCSAIETCNVTFEQAMIIGRILSATLATLLIPLVYFLGKRIGGNSVGLLASAFTTFSVGLIQYGHFATFEIWTTFFIIFQIYLAIWYLEEKSTFRYIPLLIVTGILTAIKISNIVFIVIPCICLLFGVFSNQKLHKHQLPGLLIKQIVIFFLSFTVIFSVFLMTNPYMFLASEEFQNSIQYESAVALGTLDVFYTGEFVNSVPVLFQGVKVLPFLLNPIVFVVALVSVFYFFFLTFQKKSPQLYLIIASFSLLFFSQTFLYVKWVRYMVPTLPFFYLFLAYSLTHIQYVTNLKIRTRILVGVVIGLVLASIIFSYSFLHTVYVEMDTRLHARDFAISKIPQETAIVSEVYDMGIVPFNENFSNITLFNFYDLDSQGLQVQTELSRTLSLSDYIILPSQRLLSTRLRHKEAFPIGAVFYKSLQTDTKQYTQIYETPCSLFCMITYLGDPSFRYEGTANVFDRPTIKIYKLNE